MIFSALANALHALAAVVWVGGMFFAHMALRPSVAVLEPPQRLRLWDQVFPRFFAWVWISVITLFATGLAVIVVDYGGMAGVDLHVHVMLAIATVMAVLYAYLFFVPFKAFRRAVAAEEWQEAAGHQAMIRKIVGTNLILGLITIAVAASGRFWP